MAANPFVTLARVLGGVVLMQGRLGHQVLGQLLVTGSHEVTIAGASLVIAASAREKDALSQAVIRTLAPAVAIHALTHREDKRIRAAQRELDRRRVQLAAATRGLDVRNAEIALLQATVSRQKRDVDALRRILTGLAAGAAGLLIATAAKMVVPLCSFKDRIGPAPAVVLAATLAIGVMRWPLLWVLCVLVPASIGLAWWMRR